MFLKTLLIIFFIFQLAYAQKKAKVLSPNTEVYQEADFDADIMRTVDPNENFLISAKPYGPFYKVKFKDGSIGYIPDTELDVEGVGPFQPKPYIEDQELLKNKNKKIGKNIKPEAFDEDTEDSNVVYKGGSLQMINYHEETMGAVQVADLAALGFKYQPMSSNYDSALAYEFFVAPKAPEYYVSKTAGSASGAVFWGTAQISNVSGLNSKTSIRYGAGPFLKYSYFAVNTNTQKYALQDITLGLDFGAGVMLHSRYVTMDFGLRYFWDKQSYGGIGVALLF
jgi:hypothetical protein